VGPCVVPPGFAPEVAGLAAGFAAGLGAEAAGLLGAGVEAFFSWAVANSEAANKSTTQNNNPRTRLLLPSLQFIFDPPQKIPLLQNQERAPLGTLSPTELSADRQRVAAECERAITGHSSSCDGNTRQAGATCRDHGSCFMMNFTLGMLFPKKPMAAEQREAYYWSAGADVNESFRDATPT
jgi:hypothetical protein